MLLIVLSALLLVLYQQLRTNFEKRREESRVLASNSPKVIPRLALMPIGFDLERINQDDQEPGSSSGSATDSPGDHTTLADELPRIPPRDPSVAFKTFQLHAGFRLEPVAVEPMVTDPVDACFDADGRLYVVEMRGYPYPTEQPFGRVRLLEDVDGDRVYDQGTTFLDQLDWPTAVLPYDGGVFVAVAPDIIYAKDLDNDGVADERRVVFSGFGKRNVQALLNGLEWGPDGWIYGIGSSNGGTIVAPDYPELPVVELGSRDFRFHPSGTKFEVISGAGQFGHSFDDWGHRFTCRNSNHIRQVVLPAAAIDRNPVYSPPKTVADISLEGNAAPVFRISEAEPWRVVRTRERAADPSFRARLPETELVATGFFTSATGITVYRGSAFPIEFANNVFIGDVGGNLIHRKILDSSGPIFQARRARDGVEFLRSTDNWFRPVNFRNTPDGTLLILDMYRETIEHPWSIPEPIKKHLDLTSGRDRGRIYHLVPEEFTPRTRPQLSTAPTEELVELLADRDGWYRETARRLLFERADPGAIPGLRSIVQSNAEPVARCFALTTLDGLNALEVEDLLATVNDADPRLREVAVRLAAPYLDQDDRLRRTLLDAVDDPALMVRLQVALSLGASRSPEVTTGLAEIAFRDSRDEWIRSAVMTSVHDRALELLALIITEDRFQEVFNADKWIQDLSLTAGSTSDLNQLREMVRRALDQDDVPLRLLIGMVNGFNDGRLRAGLPKLQLSDGSPFASLLQPVFEEAIARANEPGPLPEQIEFIRFVGLAEGSVALPFLAEFLHGKYPRAVQLEALQRLGRRVESSVGEFITAEWSRMTPVLRREAVEVLLGRQDRIESLLDAIESGKILPAALDPDDQERLLNQADDRLQDRVKRLLAEAGIKQDRAQLVSDYEESIVADGSSDAGFQVYQEVCATCHRARGGGVAIGPDLESVSNRDKRSLLVQVLDPNREVLPQYIDYNVATVDGRTLSGMIQNETSTSITFVRAERAIDVVSRDQIEELKATGRSLMPEGLERQVSPTQMNDLLTFIQSL